MLEPSTCLSTYLSVADYTASAAILVGGITAALGLILVIVQITRIFQQPSPDKALGLLVAPFPLVSESAASTHPAVPLQQPMPTDDDVDVELLAAIEYAAAEEKEEEEHEEEQEQEQEQEEEDAHEAEEPLPDAILLRRTTEAAWGCDAPVLFFGVNEKHEDDLLRGAGRAQEVANDAGSRALPSLQPPIMFSDEEVRDFEL